MTLVWFVIWLVANNVGAHEPLEAAPLNAWAATLILAVALDPTGRRSTFPRQPAAPTEALAAAESSVRVFASAAEAVLRDGPGGE
jgi:hypothetical protein